MSSCVACPTSGYQCSSSYAAPTLCPSGYYSVASGPWYVCTQCPAGSYCSSLTAFTPASSGYFSAAGSYYQSPILPGSVTSLSGGGTIMRAISCPSSGFYYDAGSNICKICPIGKACPNPSQVGGISCPSGTYAPIEGLATCLMCPAGKYCADTSSTPSNCPTGSFSLGYVTSSTCTQCPAGYYCPSLSSPPVLCPAGMSSTAGEMVCTPSVTSGQPTNLLYSKNPTTCAAGTYYVYDPANPIPRCNSCPAGYSCSNPAEPPKPCDSGYYQALTGQTSCTQCPAGSMCYYPNALPIACPTGASGTWTSVAGSTSCVPQATTCTAGYYSWPINTVSQLCPSGHACPPSTNINGAASTCSYRVPVLCEQGFYAYNPSYTGGNAGLGATSCTQCEAGYMCPTPHYSERVACAAGYYSAAGSINCYPIPNKMSGTTSTRPSWCNQGYYSGLLNNTCNTCPNGYTCPSDSLGPIQCPMAQDTGFTTVSSYSSKTQELHCFPNLVSYKYKAGFSTTVTNSFNNWDSLIPQRYYGQPGFPTGADGTQYPCPPGKQCLFPQDHNWVSCPPGYYDVAGYYSCQPCPEGIVCSVRRSSYQSSANSRFGNGTVQSGFFSPYGTHVQLVTPAGWYADTWYNRMIRPCPDGWYSDNGAESCTICPVGSYCPFASNSPIQCPEGQAAPSQGSYRCTPCAVTQYVHPTTKQCTSISSGYFAIAPMFTQEKCKFGTYSTQGSTITSSSNWHCKENPGYFLGSASTSSTQNGACASGYVCSSYGPWGQQYNSIPCPPGQFSTGATGSYRINQACSPCPAGKYCTGGSASQMPCPAGYYCPANTQFATQYPCPYSTSNPNTGAGDKSACVSCPGGVLCPEGTANPFTCPQTQSCPAGFGSSLCPSGQYTSGGVCTPCPAGMYCPAGSSYAFKCPSGTYTSGTSAKSVNDCTLCAAGSLCPRYGQSATSQTDYLPIPGYMYPPGTAFMEQFPCPPGTYSSGTTAQQASDCLQCPAGYACPAGSSSTTKMNCAPGYYCPAGTLDIRQFPAPTGQYSAIGSGGVVQPLTMTNCPAGSYCPLGSTKPHPCPVGYYCAANTIDYHYTPCAAGTYGATQSLSSQGQCTSCPAGSYCIPGVQKPILCPIGTFSTGGADSADSYHPGTTPCTQCTAGSFCPQEGLSAAVACGAGYFSPAGSSQCFMCQPGQLCTSTTQTQTLQESQTCSGVYCQISVYNQAPTGGSCNGVQCLINAIYQTGVCPKGYYCPAGVYYPIPCPVGTYQAGDQTSAASCLSVAAGYYNDQSAQVLSQVQVKKCSPGYYCLSGSISQYSAGCSAGTFSSESASSCTPCPAKFYCLDKAQFATPCPPGSYCPAGSKAPTMCPIGTFGASSMLSAVSDCTQCTKGYYCAQTGQSAPTGLCNAGYYCPTGTNNPQPAATICPVGGYCDMGSAEMTPCRPGYYNPYTGKKTFADCILCTPGYYCAGTISTSIGGNSGVTGQCTPGYYCLAGSTVANQYPAPPGYYTATLNVNTQCADSNGALTNCIGTDQPIQCPAGYYNYLYYQSSCAICPAGFYCQNVAMTTPVICPVGNYCPSGSQSPIVCPIGSYNPVQGGSSSSLNCLNCPPGKYCGSTGLSAPSGFCAAGYFCQASAIEPSPVALDVVSGRWGKCPRGSYCPIGTAYPFFCPIGTFSTTEQLGSATQCTPCTAGYYCETTGLTAVTGPCDPGYYCPTTSTVGQTTSRPEAFKCTPGYYCQSGVSTPQLCAAGTYQHQERQSACIDCPKGYYCLAGVSAPVICSAGYYCSGLTTTLNGTPCPAGQYQPDTGRTFCLTCPAGQYCAGTALTAPTGNCAAGYYCTGSSYVSNPTSASQGGNICPLGSYCPAGSGFPIKCPPGYACPSQGTTDTSKVQCTAGYYCLQGATTITPTVLSQGGTICPAGFYCPLGSGSPTPCPPGKYGTATMGTSLAYCQTCPAGFYCENYGTVSYQQCDEGWYCLTGEKSRRPHNAGVSQICQIGNYCTGGHMTPCSGKYQDQIGQTQCKSCPAGYQCTTTAISQCGQMNYCPFGNMVPIQCPNGYYTTTVTGQSSSVCIQCPAGYICACSVATVSGYCPSGIASLTQCPAGSYCVAGTYSAGVACAAGYYCPQGTASQVPCPPGYACVGTSNTISTITQCTQGYYCLSGSASVTNTICPAGYYCPAGTLAPVPCDINTYNPSTGSTSAAACLTCPSGQTCYQRGMSAPNAASFVCQAGFYCASATTKAPCPVGHYCPAGSSAPTQCPNGFYNQITTQASCQKCPPGYYCGDASINSGIPDQAIVCPAGNYCPIKSFGSGTPCPIGTYMPFTGSYMVSQCVPCVEGYLCLSTGMTSGTVQACPAGSYCPSGAISKTAITCPAGSYCPAGVAIYIPCPIGTVNDATGSTASSACTPCPVNYYCPYRGMQSNAAIICGAGFKCLGGAMSPQPTTAQGGALCDVGKFCTSQVLGTQDCPIGTYQPNTGSIGCINCPPGQLCASTAMTAPSTCAAGSYCLGNSAIQANVQITCPAGTYQPLTNIALLSECIMCPPGQYCTAGATAPTGPCDATFFCPIGASAQNGYSNVYVFGTQNAGLCPAGFTCAAGTTAPTPCPIGTYQPNTGQTTCLPCPGGYFCDEVGMNAQTFLLQNKLCYAGYYCPTATSPALGATTPYPNLCPAGHFCLQGSIKPEICPRGYYEPRQGSDACQLCPAGYYCPLGTGVDPLTGIAATPTIQPTQCASGYCMAGSWEPSLCPDGTFSNTTLILMASAEDCLVCPNGKYCNQGMIQGTCDAGYFCDFGAQQFRDSSKLCPQGYYCNAGTLLPTRCPLTLYYGGLGARDVSYCGPCPQGYYCVLNDPVVRMCPIGHYCPNSTIEPVPCPPGFYNSYLRSWDSSSCLSCPTGSYCNVSGIADYTKYPCPAGSYCPDKNQVKPPTPCPAGTYRNSSGAADLSGCWSCPPGSFCQQGSILPRSCDSGYYCPQGSIQPTACPPGTYCPALTQTPLGCPRGFFCPSFRTDIYTKCKNGTYCSFNQSTETMCPAGYFGTGVTWNYNSSISCVACGPGQYSDQGTNRCQDCQAGYMCYGNATTATPTTLSQGGLICPPGSYCPAGSFTSISCPVGTYAPNAGNGQLNLCLPCPINTYGSDIGATQCRPCQGSTVSDIGQATCRCVGLNRRYLTQLGQCVCVSGFTPTDGTAANIDGFSDCQQIIYNQCTPTQVRDSMGKCVNNTDCKQQCNGGNGTVDPTYGICQCQNTQTVDSVCNAECRATSLQTTFTSNGTVKVYDPVTNQTTFTPLLNTIGNATCSNPDPTQCQLVPITMGQGNSGSFQANYQLPPVLANQPVLNQTVQEAKLRVASSSYLGTRLYSGDSEFYQHDDLDWYLIDNERRLQAAGTPTPQAQYISNPIVCITLGSAMLWDNLSNETYPVYQSDSLLNTVSDFDYSAFEKLPTVLAGKTGQSFVFTFQTSGVYVFHDSRNLAKIMVISVMAEKQTCPADSKFSPMTYASLLKVGASKRDVLTPPDWTFFFLTLFGFVILIILAVLLVSYIARRNWKSSKAPTISYQIGNYKEVSRNDPEDLKSIVSINTDSSSFMFRATAGGDDSIDIDKKLQEQLKGQKNAAQLAKQHRKKRGGQDLSLNQVESLKDALQKHLKYIRKLNAINYGKDGKQVNDEFDDQSDSETSSDEEELNRQIAAVKKLIKHAGAVLRGEEDDEMGLGEPIEMNLTVEKDTVDKEHERAQALIKRREMLEQEQQDHDEKYKQKMKIEAETAVAELEDMKNKVLEQQVESAFDRGKAFQERLERDGAQKNELSDMMDQLEGKMQRVEDLLIDDKSRQNEMLKRNLEQRRLRRRKMTEKLVEIDGEIQQNDYVIADKKEEIVQEMQKEYTAEILALDLEDNQLRVDLAKKFDQMKIEKLADYQDRLRNAGGTKDFQNILDEFQRAQLKVDQELQRQRDKEFDKLDRDLKARKAKAKAQAEIKRNQKFKELELQDGENMALQTENRAKIKESLSIDQKKDEIMDDFSKRLKNDLDKDSQLTAEMEGKRREEESLRLQHERQQRKLQAEAQKEALVIDQDINDEIRRLANANEFEPFQALVNERSLLQKKVAEANTDEEKQLLLKQLKEVDDQVKNQLNAEVKDQDAALKRRLEARKQKRNTAIERERILKQSLLQQRINFALENSTNFAVVKNQLTVEALDQIIGQMKLELTPEEIPAALERLIDDKHQKELQDWLLKLYEQKAIELKEEILAMLEEKVAKQQVLRKNCEDRQRGIDCIISKNTDSVIVKDLQNRKAALQTELNAEISRLEQEFTVAESKKTREIQARCMDRETKALFDMSEMQFVEKKQIFETFLPDSLMKDLYEELGQREHEDLEQYRKELELQKQQKIIEMEEEDRILQAELNERMSKVNKLSVDEQKLIQKEAQEQRRQQKAQREKQATVSSQDVIKKIRQDLEKGLEEFSGAYEDEHKRQLAIIEAKLKNRREQVQSYQEQKQSEAKRKAEEAKLARVQEEDRIRQLRSKRQMLLSTITDGQKVILKGCYSRPLHHFNSKIHQTTVKNDDLAATLISQQEQFQSQVMRTLIQRIQDLEEKVKIQMNSNKQSNNKGRRRSSIASKLKGLAGLRATLDETASQLSRQKSDASIMK